MTESRKILGGVENWNGETRERYIVPFSEISSDELLSEFGNEYWAADRCVGDMERLESDYRLEELRVELLRRMGERPDPEQGDKK